MKRQALVYLLVFSLSCGLLSGLLSVPNEAQAEFGFDGGDVSGSSVFVFRKPRQAPQMRRAFRPAATRSNNEKVAARQRNRQKIEQNVAKSRPKISAKPMAENIASADPKGGKTGRGGKSGKGGKGTSGSSTTLSAAEKIRLSDVHLGVADYQAKRSNFPEAERNFLKSLELNPKNESAKFYYSEFLVRKGDQAFEAGEVEESARLYSEASKQNPKNAAAFASLAEILETKGDRRGAIAANEKAVTLDPTLTDIYATLGNLYYQSAVETKNPNEFQSAEKNLTLALQSAPDDAKTQNLQGLVLQQQRKFPEAVGAFQSAIRIDGNFAEAHHNLGDVYDAMDKDREATAAFLTAIELYEKRQNADKVKIPRLAEAYFDLGVANYNRARYGEAEKAYLQAVKINPTYSAALVNLGDTYEKLGKFSDATARFRTALDLLRLEVNAKKTLDNEDREKLADLYSKFGFVAGKAGQWDVAVNALQEAIRLDGENGKYNALDHTNLAWALNNRGTVNKNPNDYETARAELEKVSKEDPNYAPAKFNLGIALARLDKFSDAVAAFESCVRLRQNWAEAYNNLGFAYGLLGDESNNAGNWKNAVAALENATRIKGTFQDAHFNLGVAYLKTGDKDKAKKQQKILRELGSPFAKSLENYIKYGIGSRIRSEIENKNPIKKANDKLKEKIRLPY